MESIKGYFEKVKINGETYTVSIVAYGVSMKTIYHCYLSDEDDLILNMFDFPVDQRGSVDNKIFSAKEIMAIAVSNAEKFVRDLHELRTSIEERFYL